MLYLSALKAGETLDNRIYAALGYHPEGTPPRFLIILFCTYYYYYVNFEPNSKQACQSCGSFNSYLSFVCTVEQHE
jgi:hypothetical protein